jgi:hypothetical protein
VLFQCPKEERKEEVRGFFCFCFFFFFFFVFFFSSLPHGLLEISLDGIVKLFDGISVVVGFVGKR